MSEEVDIATLVPTTELDAINAMLDSIGEQPIASLVDIEAPDAGTALRRLHQVSRETQLLGWYWNTDPATPLTPNDDGELTLPANTLKVILDQRHSTEEFVQRGTRLYDRKNRTYTFTKVYYADLVMALPFEDLPEAARQYIMLRAAQIFQQGVLGSEKLDAFAKEAMQRAWAALEVAESETGRYNIFRGSWDTARVLNRPSW